MLIFLFAKKIVFSRVFYKSTDDRIYLLYFIQSVAGINGRWYAKYLKGEGDNVVGNLVLSSKGKPFYIGKDRKIWNYYETWNGNYDLTHGEISLD